MASDFKACCVDNCNGNATNSAGGRRGYCSKHYWHWKLSRPSAPTCSVDGCLSPQYAKSLCNKHWQRWKDHGDPVGGRTPNGKHKEFLENAVLAYSGDECLIWPYFRNHHGYGKIHINGRNAYVHRVVCERIHGPAPTPKHQAAHSCGNGHLGCCNSKHLRWATVSENQSDRVLHGTSVRGEMQWNAKLSEDDVRSIRKLAKTHTQTSIARMFDIDGSHVCDIVHRKRWAWLT